MDLNKLRKRIAEEEAKLKRFEEQKKFSQINSEIASNSADFKRALKEWALKQKEANQPTTNFNKRPWQSQGFFVRWLEDLGHQSEQQFACLPGSRRKNLTEEKIPSVEANEQQFSPTQIRTEESPNKKTQTSLEIWAFVRTTPFQVINNMKIKAPKIVKTAKRLSKNIQNI